MFKFKKQQRKDAELKKRAEAFLAEYRALSQKHMLDIGAKLLIDDNGIKATPYIVDIMPTEKPKEQ